MTAAKSPAEQFAEKISAAATIYEAGSPGSKSSSLNTLNFETGIPLEYVNIDDLEYIGTDDSEIILEIRHDESLLVRVAFSSGRATFFQEPNLQDIIPPDLEESISQAVLNEDAVVLVDECFDMQGHLSITLKNDPSKTGFHYIEHIGYLVNKLRSPKWYDFVSKIFKSASLLIVSDLGNASIKLPELDIRGTFTDSGKRRDLNELPAGQEGSNSLPSPTWISPFSVYDPEGQRSSSIDELISLLSGITCCLVYSLLASRTERTPEGISITFTGSRVVSIPNITPEPLPDTLTEMALFEWAFPTVNPGKQEAIQQAASLTLTDSSGFKGAAVPIYRTARSLYELSQRGAVAETLATRRAARSSAIGVALDSAKLAREIVTKSVERTLLQAGVAVGIIVANAKDVLDSPATAALLFVLAVFMMLSWLISYRIELASSSDAIESVSADLQEYRDSLSEDDISAIRGMRTLAQARERIKGARRTVAWVSILFTVALLAGGAFYSFGGIISVNPPKSPPATTTLILPVVTNAPSNIPSTTPQATTGGSSPGPTSGRP
ncbi:hypothetical protein [Amycolatopsis speibonae]|uniref:Uncharacterized protein n=1 Tax=Amycolatopsis speibonae TaxID=1450224 RepID=A0ABV7NV05_9PSEU